MQVGDTALGSALWIYGHRAADFGFPMAEMFRNHPDTLAQYGMLGFLDSDTRQTAQKKAAAWLEEHRNDKATRYQVKSWQGLFDGKTTKHCSPARQGWTSQGYDPDGKGESPIRIVAPPATTI